MGIPALGIPGADMFKAQYVETLHDLKLFIDKETFKSQVHI